jgi:hypothetical protein
VCQLVVAILLQVALVSRSHQHMSFCDCLVIEAWASRRSPGDYIMMVCDAAGPEDRAWQPRIRPPDGSRDHSHGAHALYLTCKLLGRFSRDMDPTRQH